MTDPSNCIECDLGEIDALTCESARIERQAEVTKESLEKLDGFRDKFDTARGTYTTALATAGEDVKSAEKQLDELDLTCRLDHDTRTRIDDLWKEVLEKIKACRPAPGCRVGECDPDASIGDGDVPAVLAGRIQVLRQEADRRGAYFDALIAQQVELPARAAKAKQDVADLATDTRGEPPANEPARLHIRGTVITWTLENVYQGFPDVDSYIDCLCQALTCVLRYWKAIVALEGARAEKACKEDKSQSACDALLADPLAELQARFDAKPRPDDGEPDGRGIDR
jgi:hypothetical protein